MPAKPQVRIRAFLKSRNKVKRLFRMSIEISSGRRDKTIFAFGE